MDEGPGIAHVQAMDVGHAARSPSDDGQWTPAASRLSFPRPPRTPRPGYRSWRKDRAFGTRVTRVSDEAGVRHRYSSKAAWNANGSLLLLDFKSGSREVRNGRTFKVLQRNVPTGSYFCWSNMKPRVGYSGGPDDSTRILRYKVSRRGAFSIVHSSNMSAIAGWSEMSFGGGQGSPSNRDLMAVSFKRRDGAWGVAVVNLKRRPVRVVSQRVFGRSSRRLSSLIDSVGISHTGRWVSVAFMGEGRGMGRGVWLFRRNLSNRSRKQLLREEEHYDWARDRRGHDVFVFHAGYGDVRKPGVWAFDAAKRRKYPLVLGMNGNVHVSGRNIRRRGWVFLASSSPGAAGGHRTVIAVDLDHPRRVRPFAHSHHSRDIGYDGEIHASASPNGRSVIFASEWGGRRIHAYVARR